VRRRGKGKCEDQVGEERMKQSSEQGERQMRSRRGRR
jgi:hypothetical protein